MSSTLRFCGAVLLVIGVGLVLAETAGWVPDTVAGAKLSWIPAAGAAFLVLGVAMAVLCSVGRKLSRTRCMRCRVRIEPGQTYCLDHLQAALHESRDHARDRDHRRMAR